MTLFSHLRLWSVVATALFAAVVSAAPVTTPTPGDSKKDESPAEKTRKALDQVTDVTIENQPLALAIQQLGEQSKINFVIDTWTIQNQLGIDLQGSAVNVKLSGVKLRSGLRTLLSQHNLSFAVVADTVVITTEEMAIHRQMRQRVSVDADKKPLSQTLKQLSRDTGTNLLLDTRVAKEAQAEVTLQLDDVPLETAVRLLGALAGLKMVRIGNVLFVTNKETANEMRQDTDLVQPNPQGVPGVQDLLLRGQLGGFGGMGFGVNPPPFFGVPVQPVPPVVVPEQAPPPPPPVPNDPPKP